MNELKIYQDINQLLQSIIHQKDSGQISSFFNFIKKNPQHAPFNNALVFTQRPECVYYMAAEQWEKRHNRKICSGARPMVILFPFGPVKFVYDFKDTEGEDNLDENSCISWWKEEKSNVLSVEIFERTIRYLTTKHQIEYLFEAADKYFTHESLSTGGYARNRIMSERSEISLHPRYYPVTNSNIEEAYGVLVHEIAHIFLGHLGRKNYSENQKGKTIEKQLCEDRSNISRTVKELEAELAAWLVFTRFGIEKKSVDYMAAWLVDNEDWQEIDISRVLRIANTIFEMRA